MFLISCYIYNFWNYIRFSANNVEISAEKYDNAILDLSGLKTEQPLLRFRSKSHIYGYLVENLILPAKVCYAWVDSVFLEMPTFADFLRHLGLFTLLLKLKPVIVTSCSYKNYSYRLLQILNVLKGSQITISKTPRQLSLILISQVSQGYFFKPFLAFSSFFFHPRLRLFYVLRTYQKALKANIT